MSYAGVRLTAEIAQLVLPLLVGYVRVRRICLYTLTWRCLGGSANRVDVREVDGVRAQ